MSEQYHNAIDIENWNRLPDAMKRNRINTYIEMRNKLNHLFVTEELYSPPLPFIVSVDDDGVTHFRIERIPNINASNPILKQIQALEKKVLAIINQNGDTADIKHVRYDKDGNREEYTAEGAKIHGELWVETT